MNDLNVMATAAMKPDADETTLLVYADALEESGRDDLAERVRYYVGMGRHPFTELRLGMTLVSLPTGYMKWLEMRKAFDDAGIPLHFVYYDRKRHVYYVPTDRLAEARRIGAKRSRQNKVKDEFVAKFRAERIG